MKGTKLICLLNHILTRSVISANLKVQLSFGNVKVAVIFLLVLCAFLNIIKEKLSSKKQAIIVTTNHTI